MHSTYYPDSPFLFPGETKNGTISNKAVYYVYQRICKKLGIEIIENVVRGPHSFRRNAISDAVNNSNGDLNLAAELYGNSVYTIKKNYYTGIDVERGKEVLNKRKLSVS